MADPSPPPTASSSTLSNRLISTGSAGYGLGRFPYVLSRVLVLGLMDGGVGEKDIDRFCHKSARGPSRGNSSTHSWATYIQVSKIKPGGANGTDVLRSTEQFIG